MSSLSLSLPNSFSLSVLLGCRLSVVSFRVLDKKKKKNVSRRALSRTLNLRAAIVVPDGRLRQSRGLSVLVPVILILL